MTSPRFEPVELGQLMSEGVLMAANERFFWPLGLALTWEHDPKTGEASNLHVREWSYPDGHVEAIGLDPDDPVAADRRDRFATWASARWLRFRDPADPHGVRFERVRLLLDEYLGATPTI